MVRKAYKNLGPRIWNLVPDNLKQLGDKDSFKTEIKNWILAKCPCRLCKFSYITLALYKIVILKYFDVIFWYLLMTVDIN